MKDAPFLTVVLVNYNTANLLDQCIEALKLAIGAISSKIIVVDNASRDNSLEVLKEIPGIELYQNQVNIGFGRANNQVISEITGTYLLLLNTDAFVRQDSIVNAIAYLEADSSVGIVGARLVGRDGVLQPSCRYFPTLARQFLTNSGLWRCFNSVGRIDDMGWDHASNRECDWVPGCFYLVRSQLVRDVGLFDPRYFLYMEEVDHCRTAKRAGWKVAYLSNVDVVHLGGESAKSDSPLDGGLQISALQIESELLYFRKWNGIVGIAIYVINEAVSLFLGLLKALISRKKTSSYIAIGAKFRRIITIAIATSYGSRSTR